MNFNAIVIQLVCISCGFMLLRARSAPKGWVAISGFILLVVGGMLLLLPAQAAWVSGSLWLILYLLPLLGFARVNALVRQERYRQARKAATLLRWLHPLDGWMEYPAMLRALELGQQGRIDEAIQRLQRYQMEASPMGRLATAMLYRTGARWQEAIAWVQQRLGEEAVFTDVAVGMIYLRSLGEIGDLNHFLQLLERFERLLEKVGDGFSLSVIKMYALAFCGQVEPVQEAFKGTLSSIPESTQQYWLATAEMASGSEAVARQRFLALRDRTGEVMRLAIDWRLSQPPIHLEETLNDTSRQTLIRLRVESGHESDYSFRRVVKGRTTYATYLLILANLLMFGLQLSQGGSDNPYSLYRLGAVIPEAVFAGEWWRIISANFMHINLTHLLMNMVGLYWLGRFVESSLGTSRFLIVYAISGIGCMLTVASLAVLTDAPPIVFIGASGAIMGLLGVMGAVLLRGWRREKARIAGRELRWIGVLVIFQIIFDLLNPEVSLIGHLSGLIFGFTTGCFLAVTPPIKPPLKQ